MNGYLLWCNMASFISIDRLCLAMPFLSSSTTHRIMTSWYKEYCTADSYAGGWEVNPRSVNRQRWDLPLFSSNTSGKSWDSTSNRLQYTFSGFKDTCSSVDGLFCFTAQRGRCVLSFGGRYCFHLQTESCSSGRWSGWNQLNVSVRW
jgi:hypothetical protein